MISRIVMLVLVTALLGACPEGLSIPALSPVVAIPGGNFTMGASTQECVDEDDNARCDPSSTAERPVFLTPFNIDRHEVTNAQYRYCVAQGSCDEPAATGLSEVPDYYTSSRYDRHPVIFVTWLNAKQYCEFVGRRLPTEAEWEFVARTEQGGDSLSQRNFPWAWKNQEERVPTCEHARLDVCKEKFPGPVESVERDLSDWEVYDLGGNVAEWVEDLFFVYTYCRDERSLYELCDKDTTCIQTECFSSGTDPKPDCVLHCDDQAPFCLQQVERLTDPKARRGGPDHSMRGGAFTDLRCKALSSFRRHAAEDAARAWVGFRCAGGRK
ncbi:MAG: formylglycine-generating enzyme family protein [Deltaproteobacteria bacterium]|nr:formylglycine-generating enzyme family protein [Deltaproteobacteria bacterium]